MTKKELIREICYYDRNRNYFSLLYHSMNLKNKSKKELEKLWEELALDWFKENKRG